MRLKENRDRFRHNLLVRWVAGYDTGIISGVLLPIRGGFSLDPFLQGLVVSSLVLGAMAVALASGGLADAFASVEPRATRGFSGDRAQQFLAKFVRLVYQTGLRAFGRRRVTGSLVT